MERVLALVRERGATWVSSTVLEVEINRNPDADRRRDVAALLSFADEEVVPGQMKRLGHRTLNGLVTVLLTRFTWLVLSAALSISSSPPMTAYSAAAGGIPVRCAFV